MMYTLSVENGILHAAITEGTYNRWGISCSQGSLYIERNKRYRLTFNAYAETDRQIWVDLSENGVDHNGDGSLYTFYDCEIVVLSTVNTIYSLELRMMENTDTDARFSFFLGFYDDDVFIDNARLELIGDLEVPAPDPGRELIVNGNFSDGFNYWAARFFSEAFANLSTESGALDIEIIEPGSAASDLQVEQVNQGFILVQDRNYHLTFDAWADADRILAVSISENGHDVNGNGYYWSNHARGTYDITPAVTTFTMDFTQDATNYDPRIAFAFGSPDADIHIDNVSLIEMP